MSATVTQPTRERRAFKTLELRVKADGDTPVITGHAAVFGLLSQDLGGFKEVIDPGAFERAITGKDDVRALVEHDPARIIGRTPRTLKLKEDSRGLFVEIDPPRTSVAQDIIESIGRGDVDSMSFGFRTIQDKWEPQDDGSRVRHLVSVELLAVSPVTFPAYVDTDVAVRSLKEWCARPWPPDEETKKRYERAQQLMSQYQL